MNTKIELDRSFIFYKVDFSKCNELETEPKVYHFELFEPIGITVNGSLIVLDNRSKTRQKNGGKPKKFWIKEEYFNSTDSPIYFETINKNYGFIVREVFPNQDITKVIAASYKITNKYSRNN